jgi:hypothetical protein
MGVQKRNKKRFTKKSCRKVFTKKSTNIQNRFFLDFVLSRFWAFLGEGSSKTPLKQYRKNKSDPGSFLASDPPRRGHQFFWGGPLRR